MTERCRAPTGLPLYRSVRVGGAGVLTGLTLRSASGADRGAIL